MGNITDNVNLINSGCKDERLKFLMNALVKHLHDYAIETRLSMAKRTTAIDFLTKTGQMCTDTRQEFIRLSDVLGLSLLVDAINHPKPPGATEGTVLGPFHTEDARDLSNGDNIGSDPDDVRVDVWETDSHGFYDVQYADRKGSTGRAVLQSDAKGFFWFEGIVPVSYPVPVDGPVGGLLRALGRHPYRPAHVHFMFDKSGFDNYITALTLRGDPYEFHDPVFGVKQSLTVDLGTVDEGLANEYGVKTGMRLLRHRFVLVTADEAAELRRLDAKRIMGAGVSFVQGRPVLQS